MNFTPSMLRALELAERGTGHVSPNPRVGAVILDNEGKIIGEGWHTRYGAPHAEVEAIKNAGRTSYEGCTIFVTLEPCSHFGKTPPCADLIIAKKFSKVVIGTLDSNPLVRGKGAEKIRDAGIEVLVGVEEEKCRYLNRAFFKYIATQKPYVMLKVAQSLDGNIAISSGESKWITSPDSRSLVQYLRANADAILVGTRTILADNPSLDVREIDFPSPKRVILDSQLSLPLNLNVFQNQGKIQSIVFYINENMKKLDELAQRGIQQEKVKSTKEGKIDLKEVTRLLGEKYQVTSLLVEGGSEIYSAFLRDKLADEIHFFIASKLIGSGIQSFGNFKLEKLADAPELEIRKFEQIGSDFYFETLVNYNSEM